MSIISPKIIIITDFFERFCGIHICTMYFSHIERIPYVRGQLFYQFFLLLNLCNYKIHVCVYYQFTYSFKILNNIPSIAVK